MSPRHTYESGVASVLFKDQERHEARRQHGQDLATKWTDGERADVMDAVCKSPRTLAATVLALIEMDFADEATLLCERVMGRSGR